MKKSLLGAVVVVLLSCSVVAWGAEGKSDFMKTGEVYEIRLSSGDSQQYRVVALEWQTWYRVEALGVDGKATPAKMWLNLEQASLIVPVK